jgi:hypothetical protein
MSNRGTYSSSAGIIVCLLFRLSVTDSGIYKFILSMLRALSALIGGAEDVLEPLVTRYAHFRDKELIVKI